MATLVLTVVGGIVGGPIGAAIGAAVGQQVDTEIFKPKGREGPQLADLKVQASTYGQQIPQMFGTMRVAGSVIWATDLIERRTKSGGGKGRPSVTEYSYSVSLAVALSSRRIRGIRRIWADGNLLRGSSGTFQERCIFRWYEGSEDQRVDPLIASAVGIPSASAFRGLAYVVFEELELASFGNRIPSLTFEVEADVGGIDAGLVGDTLLGETGRCSGRWQFGGYAASGERVREALSPLFEVDAVRLVQDPGAWRLAPLGSAGSPVALAGFQERRRGAAASDQIERRRAPLSSLPGAIRLRHYEPARDYQLGQQASLVAGGGVREQRIDLPAVLPAASARGLARQLATAAADGRETIIRQADLASLALPVGGVMTVDDGTAWRIAARTVRDGVPTIELRRHQPLVPADSPAEPGVPVNAPDWPDAVGMVAVFDCPSPGGLAATAPRILVAGAGSNNGWRGADCWVVPVGGVAPIAVGTVRPAAALGVLSESLAAGSASLFDDTAAIIVTLINADMLLESIDDAMLLGGANRAMVGDELLQFGVAEQVGPDRWRLSHLLRGRSGTARDAGHAAGARFVLLDDAALLALSDDLARMVEHGGAILQWAPRNGVDLNHLAIPGAAMALRPLAPVHGRAWPDGAGGLTIGWVRRSRLDVGWRDHVDQPLGESREAYRVALDPPVAGLGPWDCAGPTLSLEAAAVAALPPGTTAQIRQVGDFASSPPLSIPLL
jgi:hypothetical protein